MDDRFVSVPSHFIDCTMQALHGAEVKVILLLFALGALRQPVEITIDDLGHRAGVSRRAASDALADLERKGQIVRTRHKAGSHVYAYSIPESALGIAESASADDVPKSDGVKPGDGEAAASQGEPVSGINEMDLLLRQVAPTVDPSCLKQFAPDKAGGPRLLTSLRYFRSRGDSFADSNLFISALSHHWYNQGWQ
jgi:hypothetical protein